MNRGTRACARCSLGVAFILSMSGYPAYAQSNDSAGTQKEDNKQNPAGENTLPPRASLGFPLLWKGLIQGGYIARSDEAEGEPAREFRMRETQLSVEGSPGRGIHFFVEANFAEPGEEVRLNDAFVTVDFTKNIRLIAGQLRVPLNRPAVSARTALFLAEPRAAGPVQRKARDRGLNLVITSSDGRLLYEQALVNGNGIQTNNLGNDDSDLLLEGRLIWFATGKWPLALPAQTDLKNSPWSTFLKAGWASGKFEKRVTETLTEELRENTWNIGQAVVGKGLYAYWQYGQALANGERDFDSESLSLTSGYAFPLKRYLPISQDAPTAVKEAWLEPKLQYESLTFQDNTLFNRRDQEIYRFGFNYYPFGTPELRGMLDYEVVVRPQRTRALLASLHYMF